jgi:hypothetical protein
MDEPRADPTGPTGYYVPRDLDDALEELGRIMGEDGRRDVTAADESSMVRYHFGLGLWMRNNWGLWAGSRLAESMDRLGFHHPDDMSAVILDSYWRKLHGKPLDLEGRAKYYADYWARQR